MLGAMKIGKVVAWDDDVDLLYPSYHYHLLRGKPFRKCLKRHNLKVKRVQYTMFRLWDRLLCDSWVVELLQVCPDSSLKCAASRRNFNTKLFHTPTYFKFGPLTDRSAKFDPRSAFTGRNSAGVNFEGCILTPSFHSSPFSKTMKRFFWELNVSLPAKVSCSLQVPSYPDITAEELHRNRARNVQSLNIEPDQSLQGNSTEKAA